MHSGETEKENSYECIAGPPSSQKWEKVAFSDTMSFSIGCGEKGRQISTKIDNI